MFWPNLRPIHVARPVVALLRFSLVFTGETSWQKLLLSYISKAQARLTSVGSREKEAPHQTSGPCRDTSMTTIIMAMRKTSRRRYFEERKTGHLRLAYLSLTSVVTSCYIYFHMVAERRKQLHRNSHQRRTPGEVKKRRKRHQERRQRHPHHI